MNNQFIKGISINWNNISRNSYIHDIDALKSLRYLDLNQSITFLVGENGSGKSTLLEALAVASGFNAEGGTKNYRFSTYDSHSELCNAVRVERGLRKPGWGYFLRAESFYNVATKEEEYSEYSFDDGRVELCDYEDTESYQVTEMFINNREQILHRLLD